VTAARTQAARTTSVQTRPVSQVLPLLLALVFLAASAVVAALISGPMH
jgi:hypothetical protein